MQVHERATPQSLRPGDAAAALPFRFVHPAPSPLGARLARGLRAALEAEGHRTADADQDARLVVQHVDPSGVRPYRRRGRATFVVGLAVVPGVPERPLLTGYPLLVRSLSNLLVLAAPRGSEADIWLITPEQGCSPLPQGLSGEAFFARLCRAVLPLAGARLVIDNIFDPDLPEALWDGCAETRALAGAGRRLDALGVLPTPYPIREVLPPRDMRLLYRLYALGGLSYGNASVRRPEGGFWMTASGVDKSRLTVVGQDLLLVKGFDAEANAIRLSVPPQVRPNRVSVDAIEHWTIYREHPGVGAIVHAHGWVEGAETTDINYPCGSIELARTVAATLHKAPDPARAVVGLVNHGVTVTGPDMDDIFARLEGRLQVQVPMREAVGA